MSESVYRVTEVIGASPEGWEAAARNAVETAARTVRDLRVADAAGFEVVVEPGAGEAASFPDDAYREGGVALDSPWEADAVVKVRNPAEAEVARLHEGQLLIGFLDPLADRAGVERLAARGVIAFA